jgi:hypothetical protein
LNITGGAAVGTNQNGTNIIITAPTSTGTGTPSQIQLLADASGGTTGTAAATSVPRLVLNGTAALTSASAVTIVTPTIASGSMVGGVIHYTVEATDGTDYQCTSGIMAYAITNKAGTISGTATIIGTEVSNHTVGTLVDTFAVTAAGLIQITSTSVGITPSRYRVTFSVISNSQQAIVVA